MAFLHLLFALLLNSPMIGGALHVADVPTAFGGAPATHGTVASPGPRMHVMDVPTSFGRR